MGIRMDEAEYIFKGILPVIPWVVIWCVINKFSISNLKLGSFRGFCKGFLHSFFRTLPIVIVFCVLSVIIFRLAYKFWLWSPLLYLLITLYSFSVLLLVSLQISVASMFIKSRILKCIVSYILIGGSFLLFLPAYGAFATFISSSTILYIVCWFFSLFFFMFAGYFLSSAKMNVYRRYVLILLIGATISTVLWGTANLIMNWKIRNVMYTIKSKGIETNPENLMEYIPSSENGAVIYKRIFRQVEDMQNKYKTEMKTLLAFKDEADDFFHITKQKQLKVKKFILNNPDFQALLKDINEAEAMPVSIFFLNYEQGGQMLVPHLSSLWRISRILCNSARILLNEENYQDALSFCVASFKLSHSLDKELISISKMFRCRIVRDSILTLKPLLCHPSHILAENDFMEFFELTYKGNNSHLFSDEAWMMISEFSQMLKGRTSIGEGSMWFDTDKVVSPPCISLCRDMYLSTIHVPRNFNKIGQFLYNYHYFALRPMIKSDFVYYMGQVWNLSEIERLPYYKSRQMLISMDRNITKYINSNALNRVWSILLLRGSIGGSAGMMDRFFQNNLSQCVYDCFKITSALKIYKLKTGMYPTHLEELAPNILKQIPLNPFSGEEYTYKPQKRGFLLHPEYNSLIDYLGIDRSKILSEYLLWRCPN